MNESTVFQINKVDKVDEVNKSPSNPSTVAPPGVILNPDQAAKPPAKPSVSFEVPPDNDSGGSLFSKIIKGILGFFIVGIIIFLIFHFVIPQFSKNNNEKATLSVWGLWESDAIMKNVINDFQKENPNITIDYKKEDIKQQYRDKIVARVKNGTGPDIFLFHNSWLSEMSSLLLPFPSDVIQKDEFQKVYYPVVVSDLTKNGAIYGIPSGIDTLALFTNTEIFNQSGALVPSTWQDFGKTARSLTVKDENGKIKTSGSSLGTFDNVTHVADIISLLLVQNGADLYNLSNTSQNAIDAFDYYTDFAKNEGKVWDDTLDPSIVAFAKGNLAMYFGYSWDIFTIKAMNPNLSFKISPVPHLPGRNMTIVSYWSYGISEKSLHQKEALLFMNFLAKKETLQKLFTEESKTRLFGQPYARIDLAESLKSNSLVFPFVSQASDANSSFFASDTYDNGLNSQMNAYLANTVRSILNGSSTETAVDTLIKGVDQVLNQYK